MLDIMVRDATDNARSLDDVMKRMYDESYRQGKGFTESEWWSALRSISGLDSFRDFHDAFIDGREDFPWDELLPLAGLELARETNKVARVGISTQSNETGVHITSVVPGSSAAGAGVMVGDNLIGLGGRPVESASFGAQFRSRFAGEPAGTPVEYEVLRDGAELTLQGELKFADVTTATLGEDPEAGPKAVRVRNGLLTGANF
jgi:predicted metalloprotease with PDZ domain